MPLYRRDEIIRGLIISLLLSLITFKIEAFTFRNYSVGDGLPSSEVYEVIQDHENYLWFSTDRGVCRYNGAQFKVFTQADGLPGDVVFGFYLDTANRLWMYTYTGGIVYYANGKIHEPEFNTHLRQLLKKSNYPLISSFYIDEDQTIWLGTHGPDLYKVNQLTNRIERIRGTKGKDKITLWDIAPEHPKGFVFTEKKLTEGEKINGVSFLSKTGSPIYSETLSIDQNIIAHPARVLRLQDSISVYAYGRKVLKIGPEGILQSIYMPAKVLYCESDAEGNLWLGTRNGMFCYSDADLSKEPLHLLESYDVSSVLQDREGGWWFTTLNHGIFYAPNLIVRSIPKARLGNSRLSKAVADQHGVYVTSNSGHIYFFADGKMEPPVLVSSQLGRETSMKYSLDGVVVFIDDRNQYHELVKSKTRLYPDSLWFDRNDDRSSIYWALKRSGLYINDLKKAGLYHFLNWARIKMTAMTRLPASQEIWCGSVEGLYRIEQNEIRWIGNQFPELNCRIADLDVIDDEHLLVSTRGKGAWILNGMTHTLTRIKNIPNAHCHASIVDQRGNLWLATFDGVFKVSSPLNQPLIERYGYHEGLISNEAISLLEYQNEIWVVTSEGISVFDSDWEPPNIKDAPLEILNIQINHRDTSLQQRYELDHYQNNIVISCNVISTMMPIAYEYKMSGLQEDWIRMRDQHIVFTDLRPGDYVLSLRTGHAGQNSEIKQLSFHISSPVWKTSWFQFGVLGILLSFVMVAGRIRHQVLSRENKLYRLFVKSERKALRSQMNPHFLFNALNLLLDLLMSKKNENAIKYVHDLAMLMRKILEHSRREFISLQEEIHFLELYLKIGGQRFANQLKYHIEISPALHPPNCQIPPLLIQPYIENALKHGVASRKDGQARIDLKLYEEEGKLNVRIMDNGIGYDTHSSPKGHRSLGMQINGERFRLLNEEAIDFKIQSLFPESKSPFKGTLVHLTLPLIISQ